MKRKVLFLCTDSSCRSQIAEAVVNARGKRTHHSFPDPAITNNMDDFRKVRDDIEREITQLLTQIG